MTPIYFPAYDPPMPPVTITPDPGDQHDRHPIEHTVEELADESQSGVALRL